MPLVLSHGARDPGPTDAHVALIVEDDPIVAEVLQNLASSLGHEWIHAVTLDDVREALARGGYCYVLLDMQIPSTAGAPPIVGCGETALRLLREKEPARNAEGKHRLQIVVVTSYSREPEFVTRLLKMDANDFVAKPIASPQIVPDKVREALAAADRVVHSRCANGAPSVRAGLVIDGEKNGRRTGFLVNGERRELQDAKFVALLRLVVALEDSPGTWVSKGAMGLLHAPETPSRIRAQLHGLLPKGVEVVETDKGGSVRLNPKVVVEARWEALEKHAEGAVQRMARERRKRG